MTVITFIGILAALFVLIGLAEPLASRLRLPFTVMLAGIGVLLGAGAAFFLATTLTDALNPVAAAITNIPIRANTFLYVFLPTLLFQVALGLNVRRMLDDWVPILVMAVLAVIIATFSIGYALSMVAEVSLVACLLIGAIVSTTDPSAVVSIFRNIAAPQRLTRIVEGESLLNDAAAIALFGLFIAALIPGQTVPGVRQALTQLPVLVFGGALVGWFIARLAVWLMALTPRHPLAQVSISVALPYLAYLGAEQVFGASGVIAVVAAGLTLNLTGPGRLTPATWTYLREVWNLLAHWSGALIFILAALLIPQLLGGVRWSDLGLLAVVVGAAFAARLMVLFLILPLLTMLSLSPRVDRPYRLAILWGGLRGAVTLALALAVTENPLVPAEVKRLVGILATGFALFTLIVQGTTLRMVIAWLGLDRLSPLDTALSNQVIAVALQTVREDVADLAQKNNLNRDIVRVEAKSFANRLNSAVTAAETGAEILDRDRITLGLVALAGRERDLILDHFRQQIISTRLVEQMLSDVDRLIERTRHGGRTEYRRAGRQSLGQGRPYRFAVFLNNRLRLSRSLARLSAERFEMLLNQRLILRALHGYINSKIRRIHGRRVAELLHELLDRRTEETENALEGLRLQYPGYAEELERRFIRRTALRFEEREYDTLRADGLIGPELYTTLKTRLAQQRAGIEIRPKLDLALQKTEMVSRFDLFAKMTPAQQKRLARALRAVYVAPGDVVMRKGDAARKIFFIASGAMEMEIASQKQKLGRGEMFGSLAVLARQRRNAHVTALSHSTLLTLDDTRFLRLLKASPTLRKAVTAAAAQRGVTLTDEMLSPPSPRDTALQRLWRKISGAPKPRTAPAPHPFSPRKALPGPSGTAPEAAQHMETQRMETQHMETQHMETQPKATEPAAPSGATVKAPGKAGAAATSAKPADVATSTKAQAQAQASKLTVSTAETPPKADAEPKAAPAAGRVAKPETPTHPQEHAEARPTPKAPKSGTPNDQ
ncbi:cation:proton antiporter domain-containing protein [Roseicitreum antarcticum]|uniref:Sodium/proton antiporter, CPA1 family n=1 Tax=Roseicitreum antarcticum TaxID=564137 RepID=A0A1H2S4H4_9RHOB|nr:cation:proton antiporter [Roseicitreum antarcticum]SDW26405.1 sodium/proton antiporter, CPA1 family [Roseicitreum antarcticum]